MLNVIKINIRELTLNDVQQNTQTRIVFQTCEYNWLLDHVEN